MLKFGKADIRTPVSAFQVQLVSFSRNVMRTKLVPIGANWVRLETCPSTFPPQSLMPHSRIGFSDFFLVRVLIPARRRSCDGSVLQTRIKSVLVSLRRNSNGNSNDSQGGCSSSTRSDRHGNGRTIHRGYY